MTRRHLWLEPPWLDVVFGVRTQLKTPAASLALALTLALGIAATSVSFTITNSLFLRSLPVERPDQLVRIYATSSAAGSQYLPTSYPDFLDIRAERSIFAGVAARAGGAVQPRSSWRE
jgi:hypothetical protein